MKDFLVKIDKENPLFKEFKKWYESNCGYEFIFNYNYYGVFNGFNDCFDNPPIEPISLEEWHEEFIWQPIQGEAIQASKEGSLFWECFFVAKYGYIYIVENCEGELIKVNQIRKYNPLSEDIERLKEKAKSLGLKIDIIYEKMV